jgi:MYXO-CTERM domain-containing protein
MNPIKITLFIASLSFMTAAHGALLFYEGFDYTAGDLDGQGGWSATSQMQVALNGTDTDTYTGTYASVTTTGGYAFNTTGSGGLANVALGSSVTSTFTTGSVTWLSFIDIRGTNGANAKGAFAIGAAALTGTSMTNPSMVGDGIGLAAHDNNADEAAYWSDSGVNVGGTDIPGGTGRDRFNIAKITWSDGGNDTIEWAFFDAGTTISLANFDAASKSTVSADLDQSTFDTLSLGSNFMHFDEIRIASDFTSAVTGTVVVPEPSAALLGGLGLLALLRRRRN